MKMLLTSAGIGNNSIREALVELLGKPIGEASALCIPTALHALPGGAGNAWRFVAGQEPRTPMCELGWKSLGLLELTALPSLEKKHWVAALQKTDALLVGGGDPLYLCHWMRQSGLAELLPTLQAVYVGLSAGSMVMAPKIGKEFVAWTPPTGNDETLNLVDFAIFPHLDHPALPDNSMKHAEQWAANLPLPCYALDDQSAIKISNGTLVEVVSEGHWKRFAPQGLANNQ